MTCTADSDYIRAVSVRYRRCPSGYSVRSAVARTGFEVTPLNRPRTAQQTVPSVAQPRAQTAIAQGEKRRLLEELMFFYGRGVSDSFSFSRSKTTAALLTSSPERQQKTHPAAVAAAQGSQEPPAPAPGGEGRGSTFMTDSSGTATAGQDRPHTTGPWAGRGQTQAQTQTQKAAPLSASLTPASPWACQNDALRQMCKATSKRRPRHKFFPRGSLLPANRPDTSDKGRH